MTLPDLLSRSRRARENAQRPPGVLVTRAFRGTPAYRAGLRKGDRILSVDGRAVRDRIDVEFYTAEETVRLELERQGERLEPRVNRDYGETFGVELEDPPLKECANLCPFCFVDQHPASGRFRKGLKIYDDDYRYSFLYGHYVTLTNLSAADLDRIRELRLSPLYISVHATDPDVRAKVLGRPRVDVRPVLDALRHARVEVHTQIVMMPGVNDGPVMERTIKDLYRYHPAVQSVAIVPVGLTGHHTQGVARWTAETAKTALAHILDLGAKYPLGFVQAADEWFSLLHRDPPPADYYGGMAIEENGVGMVRRMLDDWKAITLPKRVTPRSALIVTGRSPERYLRRLVDEMRAVDGADLELAAVPNRTFGEETTVTGLLSWRDIEPVVAASARAIICIPDVLLNADDRFLDNVSVKQAAKRCGRTLRVLPSTAQGLRSILQ
jgi:putative radical SAM enzyme (TIGR03279 family)